MIKILIVEDDKALSDVLREKFKNSGFSAFVAGDGIEGLVVAEKENPDMILLDILMPKMDGISMLKELRKKDWGKNIPVIMLTNLSDNENVAESMANGTFDYLVKSNWKIDDVVKVVKEKLEQKA